ncbi:MAG TPA: STAS domain-containing protein [Balneolales bacterium]|nr:STAS domain-containing protein [Balneolales bacterium]
MNYELDHEGNISILKIKNEKLDSTVAPDLKSQIIILTNATDHEHLILDLKKVTFADSSGLSALLLAHRLYRDSNRHFVICNLADRIHELLKISQLNNVLNISSNPKEAMTFIKEAS